ncbi:hypothetical protein AB1Y20_004790 [Prymnesium parvum]|uniref:CHAT domain-containing protein n=1 Tax=Prymnesium parvum TaxID=97485 RepID=A0AB34IXS4_PRYPA
MDSGRLPAPVEEGLLQGIGWSGGVLGVFAQPKTTHPLRLQSEQREISQALSRSRHRDQIVFDALAAATIDDVRRALLTRRYDVVHFAGHGDFDAPLIRWLVESVERLGVAKTRLSQQRVRHEVKAAKARLLGTASDSFTLIRVDDLLLPPQAGLPAGEEPAGASSETTIKLTVSVLEELGAGALALEDEEGAAQPPNPLALAQLLKQSGVRMVILNACETEYQGKLLLQEGVPFVVATGSALSDLCAAEYARAFYDYMFNARSNVAIERCAHEHAILALRLKSLNPERHGAPKLMEAADVTELPAAARTSGIVDAHRLSPALCERGHAASAERPVAEGGHLTPAARREGSSSRAALADFSKETRRTRGVRPVGDDGEASSPCALAPRGECSVLATHEAETMISLSLACLELGEIPSAAEHVSRVLPPLEAAVRQLRLEGEPPNADVPPHLAATVQKLLADAYILSARVKLHLGDIFEADSALVLALELYDAVADAKGIAHALRLRGNVLGLMGHTESAIHQLERALPLLVALADQAQQASSLKSLGELHMQWAVTLDNRRDFRASALHRQRAVSHLEAALRIYRTTDDPKGEANTLRALGQLYMDMGQFGEAKVCMERALPLFTHLKQRLASHDIREGKASLKLMHLLGEEIVDDPEIIWRHRVGKAFTSSSREDTSGDEQQKNDAEPKNAPAIAYFSSLRGRTS